MKYQPAAQQGTTLRSLGIPLLSAAGWYTSDSWLLRVHAHLIYYLL